MSAFADPRLAEGVVAAIGLSAALSAAVAACGPVDPPRARGSHARPTPTSGGLAILAAATAGAAIAGVSDPRAVIALACAGGLGLLGAVDDLLDIGAKAKLGLQMVLALVFAATVARVQAIPLTAGLSLPLGAFVGAVGSALWIVVATNAVNFMDGANGLAPGAMVVAFASLAVGAAMAREPGVATVSAMAAAAGAGFLPFNLKGRLFQGDAGALFSGFLFASLCLVAERGGTGVSVLFGPVALLPFLADVLLTLLHRARRGRSLLEAHRDHLYQLWLRTTGRSHGALAWRTALVIAGFGLCAIALQAAPPPGRLAILVAAAAACVAGWTALRRRLERERGDEG